MINIVLVRDFSKPQNEPRQIKPQHTPVKLLKPEGGGEFFKEKTHHTGNKTIGLNSPMKRHRDEVKAEEQEA